ncbi:MAG: hypothetical protein WA532_07395 [Candidatus Korobacteraceae bacterium]
MRELIRHMNDVRQTLDSEEQTRLTQALAELEKQRDRLLHALFGAAVGAAKENTP